MQTKTTPTDPVTIVDTETEQLLRDRLAQLRSGDAVLGEESGGPADPGAVGDGAVTWVVDPIDGTVNFVYGIPAYAVSVAAQINGVSVAGAVADVQGGRLYSAATGLGAQVVDAEGTRALRCSAVTDLSLALVGTGFAYSGQRRTAQAELVSKMLPTVRDVRRIGSAALDLCMVAAGRLDAYYEHGLKVWDYAAGALIAAEAGARVLLPAPGDPERNAAVVVAAAPGIADRVAGPAGGIRRAGADSGLTGQQVVAWIFASSAGSAGSEEPGLQSGEHGSDVVAVRQRAELGAQHQVDGIVGAVVAVELGARCHQPYRRGPGLTGFTEPDLPLAGQPGLAVDRIVGRGRLGETDVLQRAGDVGGLTAASAGVQDAQSWCRSAWPVRR